MLTSLNTLKCDVADWRAQTPHARLAQVEIICREYPVCSICLWRQQHTMWCCCQWTATESVEKLRTERVRFPIIPGLSLKQRGYSSAV